MLLSRRHLLAASATGPTTVLAAKQAVEDFKPEDHGFEVEILSADHQQKPDIASGIARQWYDRDGVDAVADLNNTAIALAVNNLSTEKNKAQLDTGPASARRPPCGQTPAARRRRLRPLPS